MYRCNTHTKPESQDTHKEKREVEEEKKMTTMAKKNNPAIMDKLISPATLMELEEASGGITVAGLWRAMKCKAGFHDYNERFEYKDYCPGWMLSRCVSTCKYCGHTEYDAWVLR